MMTEPSQKEQKLMQVWLDIAEALLNAGAEISRVEDTLHYLAAYHDVKEIDAFTITAGILVSCTFSDGNTITQTRRVMKSPSMDIHRIEKLNSLSRDASAEKLSAKELEERFRKIIGEEMPWTTMLGSVMAAASFCIFFGGSLMDAVVSGLFGIVICLFSKKIGRYITNNVFYNFLASLMAGTLIYLTGRLLPTLHVDKVIIGDIMLLVPGLTITIAMRDMLSGDTISGLLRFVESLLWTGGLAAGFLVSMFLAGGAL